MIRKDSIKNQIAIEACCKCGDSNISVKDDGLWYCKKCYPWKFCKGQRCSWCEHSPKCDIRR